MPDDRLVIEGEFNPAGIIKGLDIGIASVEQFEQALRKSIQKLPELGKNEQQFAATSRAVADEVKRAAQEAAVFERRIQEASAATGKFSIPVKDAHRATNLLRGGLVSLAAQATGAGGAIGQVGQSLAFAFGGGGIAIGAAAIIGGIALAYDKLTESSRELRKEVDALVKSFDEAHKTASQKLAESIEKVGQDIENSEKKIRVMRELLLTGTKYDEEIKRLQHLRQTLQDMREEAESLNLKSAGAQFKPLFEAANTTTHAVKLTTAALKELAAQAAIKAAQANRTQGTGGTAQGPFTGGALIHGATGEEVAEHIQAVTRATEEAADATRRYAMEEQKALEESEAAFDVERVNKMVDAIYGLGSAISAVGRAFGFLNDQAQQVLSSVVNLGASIAHHDLFGAITAGADLIGSLFGGGNPEEDARAAEHADIMRANNDALDAATAAIKEWDDSIEAVNRARADLGGLDPSVLAHVNWAAGQSQGGALGAKILDAELQRVGSSLKELDAIARANGIQLLDKDGYLVAGALEVLKAKLDLASEAAAKNAREEAAAAAQRARDELAAAQQRTAEIIAASQQEEAEKWARELQEATDRMNAFIEAVDAARIAFGAETRSRLDLRRRLTPEDEDPFAVFADQLAGTFAGAQMPDIIRDALGNLDLNTPELRNSFRDRLVELLDAVNQGAIKPEELGLTSDQFNQLLADSADFLDTFKDAVDDATASMLNVPKGLNVAEMEWMARLKNPEPVSPTGPHGPLGPIPNIPFTPPQPWEGGAARPGPKTMTESVAQWTINVNGVTDPAAVADLVLTRVRRVAGSTFGDTQRWSQL